MAVTAIPLTTGSSTTDTQIYTTDSVSPTPGRLVLLGVYATVASGSFDLTASSGGLNWVKVEQTTAGARTLFMFRAMGSAPSAGPITLTGSVPLTSAMWQVVEFNGADTSGTDGSGAIVQSKFARLGSTASVRVAFDLTVGTGNAAYGLVGISTREEPTVGGAPWVALGSAAPTNPWSGFLGEFAQPAAQQVTASWTTAANSHVVAAEIKAAASAGTPTGAATGSWGFTGVATGRAAYRGTASGTWSFTGAAVGGNAPVGRATGSWSFTGAAVGVSERTGTAVGTWRFTGTAVGTRTRSGTASGTWGFTGRAVGFSPDVVELVHTYARFILAAESAAVSTFTLLGPRVGGFGLDFGTIFGAPAQSLEVGDGVSTFVLDGDGIATLTVEQSASTVTIQTET